MTKKELEAKVDDLARRVKDLEAQPREYHYHYYPPVYVQPYVPAPTIPSYPWSPIITWSDTSTAVSVGSGTLFN